MAFQERKEAWEEGGGGSVFNETGTLRVSVGKANYPPSRGNS